MKKALLFPSRHDDKIAAALAQMSDTDTSVYEKHIARGEWQRLVMRQRLERRCIAVKAAGRYGLFVVVAIVIIFFRPPAGAFLEGRVAELWFPLLLCGTGAVIAEIAKQMAEKFREMIAQRFPSGDDLEGN